MPLSSILVLTGIVSAFALFGIVLAWGEYQTRNINRGKSEAEARAAGAANPSKQKFKKAA